MKKLLTIILLLTCLTAVPLATQAMGCVLLIQNTDVDPNYPDCIKHMDSWRCDGQFIIVTYYECY